MKEIDYDPFASLNVLERKDDFIERHRNEFIKNTKINPSLYGLKERKNEDNLIRTYPKS